MMTRNNERRTRDKKQSQKLTLSTLCSGELINPLVFMCQINSVSGKAFKLFPHATSLQQTTLKSCWQNMGNVIKSKYNFLLKTLWKKKNLLIMCNVSSCHKKPVQTLFAIEASTCGKGLKCMKCIPKNVLLPRCTIQLFL